MRRKHNQEVAFGGRELAAAQILYSAFRAMRLPRGFQFSFRSWEKALASYVQDVMAHAQEEKETSPEDKIHLRMCLLRLKHQLYQIVFQGLVSILRASEFHDAGSVLDTLVAVECSVVEEWEEVAAESYHQMLAERTVSQANQSRLEVEMAQLLEAASCLEDELASDVAVDGCQVASDEAPPGVPPQQVAPRPSEGSSRLRNSISPQELLMAAFSRNTPSQDSVPNQGSPPTVSASTTSAQDPFITFASPHPHFPSTSNPSSSRDLPSHSTSTCTLPAHTQLAPPASPSPQPAYSHPLPSSADPSQDVKHASPSDGALADHESTVELASEVEDGQKGHSFGSEDELESIAGRKDENSSQPSISQDWDRTTNGGSHSTQGDASDARGLGGRKPCRELPLKRLHELIKEVYASKAKSNARCLRQKSCQETMKQHLYTFLNHKFGVRALVIDGVVSITASIERHSSDVEVAVFDRVLAGELEESFQSSLDRTREATTQLLTSYFRNLYAHEKRDKVESLVAVRLNPQSGWVSEEEWLDLLRYMYPRDQANQIIAAVHALPSFDPTGGNSQGGTPRSAGKSWSGRGSVEKERCVEFSAFMNTILLHHLQRRQKTLQPVLQAIRQVDEAATGVLSVSQCQQVYKIATGHLDNNEWAQIEERLDPFNLDQVIVSSILSNIVEAE